MIIIIIVTKGAQMVGLVETAPLHFTDLKGSHVNTIYYEYTLMKQLPN